MFTRKPSTDVSYLACARLLAGTTDVIYPQFATHNAQTVAYVAEVFGNAAGTFEFQRLHGMGEELYSQVDRRGAGRPSRAACMRRSGRMRICCRISCAGCWRTARTRRS